MDTKKVDGLVLLLLHNQYDLNLVPNFFQLEKLMLDSLESRVYFTRTIIESFKDNPDYICFLDYCLQNLFRVVSGADWKGNEDLSTIKNLLFSKLQKRFVNVRTSFTLFRFSHLLDIYVDVSKRTDPSNENFSLGYYPELTTWIRESVKETNRSSGGRVKDLLKDLDFMKNKVDPLLKKHGMRIQYSDLLLNSFLKEKELDLSLIGELAAIFPEQSGRFVRLFKVSVMPKIRKETKLLIKSCISDEKEEEGEEDSCRSIGPSVLHSNSCKEVLEILFEPLNKIEEIENILESKDFMRRLYMEEIFSPQVKKFVKHIKESISQRYKDLQSQKYVRVGREEEEDNKKEEIEEEELKIEVRVPVVYLNNLEEVYQQLRSTLTPRQHSEDHAILEYVKKTRNKVSHFVAKKFIFKYRTKELLRDGFNNLNDLFCQDLNKKFCVLSKLIYLKIFFLVIKHLIKIMMNEIIDIVLSSKEKGKDSFRVKVKTHRLLVGKLEKLFNCKGNGIEMEYIKKYSSQLDHVFDMIEKDGEHSVVGENVFDDLF